DKNRKMARRDAEHAEKKKTIIHFYLFSDLRSLRLCVTTPTQCIQKRTVENKRGRISSMENCF
ncbi:MAG: hypothetical protein ACLFVE_13870, partial [Chitinispirillaceae bacterium]